MTSTQLFPSGAWEISAMIDGYLVFQTYYGCTKREAQNEFRARYMPTKKRRTRKRSN